MGSGLFSRSWLPEIEYVDSSRSRAPSCLPALMLAKLYYGEELSIFSLSLSFFPRALEFTDTYISPQPSLKLSRYLVIFSISYISLSWRGRKSFSILLSSSYPTHLIRHCHVERYDRRCHAQRSLAITRETETRSRARRDAQRVAIDHSGIYQLQARLGRTSPSVKAFLGTGPSVFVPRR